MINTVRRLIINIVYFLYNLFNPNYRHNVKYILVIGHMRAGSSLLVQLLRNSKEIIGMGESHLIYNSDTKLGRLCCKLLFYNQGVWGSIKKYTYALDKILHNHYLPKSDWSILLKNNISIIFILREPQGTIRSLKKSLGLNTNASNEYYTSRLTYIDQLSSYLKENGIKYYFLSYNELTDHPDIKLEELTDYLNLKIALTKKYEIQSTTGKKGFGDFSSNILSGDILKSESDNNLDKIPNQLYEAYKKTLANFANHE